MATRHHYTKRPSANVKTGPLTVTRTDSTSCPKSCPLLGNGCYDQQGNGAIHRRRVDSGQYETLSVAEFMRAIRNFTHIYRHNEGGDLWNGKTSEHICADTLKTFATSNRLYRRTPIVYTLGNPKEEPGSHSKQWGRVRYQCIRRIVGRRGRSSRAWPRLRGCAACRHWQGVNAYAWWQSRCHMPRYLWPDSVCHMWVG